MSWNYTNDPENNTTDEIRLLIGDTDSTDEQLSDEELAYYIAQEGDIYAAAASAARGLAANFARKADKEVDDLSIRWSQLQDHYLALAEKLDVQSTMSGVRAYLGGRSKADKLTQEQDTDRVKPQFIVRQFKNPRSTNNFQGRRRGCDE